MRAPESRRSASFYAAGNTLAVGIATTRAIVAIFGNGACVMAIAFLAGTGLPDSVAAECAILTTRTIRRGTGWECSPVARLLRAIDHVVTATACVGVLAHAHRPTTAIIITISMDPRSDAAAIIVMITGTGDASIDRARIAVITVRATSAGADRDVHTYACLHITAVIIVTVVTTRRGGAVVIIVARLGRANARLPAGIIIVIIPVATLPRGDAAVIIIVIMVSADAMVFRTGIAVITGRARRGACVCAEVIVHVIPVVALLAAVADPVATESAISPAGAMRRRCRDREVASVALLSALADAVAAARNDRFLPAATGDACFRGASIGIVRAIRGRTAQRGVHAAPGHARIRCTGVVVIAIAGGRTIGR